MEGKKPSCCDETGYVFALAKLASKAYRGWVKANEALNKAEVKLAQAREAVKDGAEITKEQLAKIEEIAEEVARRTRYLEEAAEAVRQTAS
jgi:hypothetical protein